MPKSKCTMQVRRTCSLQIAGSRTDSVWLASFFPVSKSLSWPLVNSLGEREREKEEKRNREFRGRPSLPLSLSLSSSPTASFCHSSSIACKQSFLGSGRRGSWASFNGRSVEKYMEYVRPCFLMLHSDGRGWAVNELSQGDSEATLLIHVRKAVPCSRGRLFPICWTDPIRSTFGKKRYPLWSTRMAATSDSTWPLECTRQEERQPRVFSYSKRTKGKERTSIHEKTLNISSARAGHLRTTVVTGWNFWLLSNI